MYVGTRSEGKVYALVDADGDMVAERVAVVARTSIRRTAWHTATARSTWPRSTVSYATTA